MYTSHHPCWDAKNRYGLPDECDFDYEVIRHIVENSDVRQEAVPVPEEKGTDKLPDFMSLPEADVDETVDFDTGEKIQEKKEPKPAVDMSRSEVFRLNDYIPKALQDLMYVNLVSEEELMEAVYLKYSQIFPKGTPFVNLPSDYVDGVLIAAWPQVLAVIKKMRSEQEIPFN